MWFPFLLEQENSGGIMNMIVMLLPMFVIFYFLIIRPQNKQNRLRQEMITNLKKNDRILTTGGIYGTVAALQDDVVTLLIDDSQKVRIRVSKQAIGQVLVDEPAGK